MNRWRNAWYGGGGTWPLAPLAWGYGKAVALRRRWLGGPPGWRPPVPVIVVGNITVGGSGKTPVVIALVDWLQRHGYRPAVVSRGYGGRPRALPLLVGDDTPAAEAGDEPLLIRRRTGCPVVVDPDRVRAARAALAHSGCDILVADDGLQHYRLARDIEIAVVDGVHGLGNGRLLPAGPLREPPARLAEVDCVLVKGDGGPTVVPGAPHWHFDLAAGGLTPLAATDRAPPEPGARVHAVAGIAWPEQFFETLSRLGYDVIAHPHRDHAVLDRDSVEFDDGIDVVMTEKDAVKCLAFATPRHWCLPVSAEPDPAFWAWFAGRLEAVSREYCDAP